MNETTTPSGCLCPDCPSVDCWSSPQFAYDASVDVYLAIQSVPKWKKALRRVNGYFILSDLYYFIAILSLLAAFADTFASFGLDCSAFTHFQRALLAAGLVIPVVAVRAAVNALSDYLVLKRFESECAADANQSS